MLFQTDFALVILEAHKSDLLDRRCSTSDHATPVHRTLNFYLDCTSFEKQFCTTLLDWKIGLGSLNKNTVVASWINRNQVADLADWLKENNYEIY